MSSERTWLWHVGRTPITRDYRETVPRFRTVVDFCDSSGSFCRKLILAAVDWRRASDGVPTWDVRDRAFICRSTFINRSRQKKKKKEKSTFFLTSRFSRTRPPTGPFGSLWAANGFIGVSFPFITRCLARLYYAFGAVDTPVFARGGSNTSSNLHVAVRVALAAARPGA